MSLLEALHALRNGKHVSPPQMSGSIRMDKSGLVRWDGTNTLITCLLDFPKSGWKIMEVSNG